MTETSFRIYVEPVAKRTLFNINLNHIPQEVEIVWTWDVRELETKPQNTYTPNFTSSSLASGVAASKGEAHQEAEKWADALAQKAQYTYTPKGK